MLPATQGTLPSHWPPLSNIFHGGSRLYWFIPNWFTRRFRLPRPLQCVLIITVSYTSLHASRRNKWINVCWQIKLDPCLLITEAKTRDEIQLSARFCVRKCSEESIRGVNWTALLTRRRLQNCLHGKAYRRAGFNPRDNQARAIRADQGTKYAPPVVLHTGVV